ncbi:DUF2264 domain-containing protein [Microbulbifer rhizosphaerae]|uniref:DUF2264 domain-containing protein n=1 Tax=Microbulbifer rhizosphaerae TaxID=1562603 RepID=A0A7W4Z9X4_9GAMM|nr:DUF2264 domain-containing protein [Microbulbifer rhizosphaerae]MBB3060719.1 hypothetical protein [Microbulbifer rhizosphaerae]
MNRILKFSFHTLSALVLVALVSLAKAQTPPQDSIFIIDQPNYELSPHTGLTRKHWEDAALYLLEGAFSHIENIDDPMLFPDHPGAARPVRDPVSVTAKLEGLSRTLFGASVLLKQNPELQINGIKLSDYYRHHLVELTNLKKSSTYIPPRAKDGGASHNLVEFGAVAISLFVAPEVLWNPLRKAQKDALAATMISYGDGPTVPSNFLTSMFSASLNPRAMRSTKRC